MQQDVFLLDLASVYLSALKTPATPYAGCLNRLTGLQWDFPVAQGKRILLQCRRLRLDPGVRKIPWREKWHPTPVFLPGESHGQRSLEGYSP